MECGVWWEWVFAAFPNKMTNALQMRGGGGDGYAWNQLSYNQNKAKMRLSFTHNN